MIKLDKIIGDIIFISFANLERFKDIGITRSSGHYLLKGYDYRVYCEKATKLASISVTKYGTYLSIPNRDEIADVNNLTN